MGTPTSTDRPFDPSEGADADAFLDVVESVVAQGERGLLVRLGEIGAIEALEGLEVSLPLSCAVAYAIGRQPQVGIHVLPLLSAVSWCSVAGGLSSSVVKAVSAGEKAPAVPGRLPVTPSFTAKETPLGREITGRDIGWLGEPSWLLWVPRLRELDGLDLDIVGGSVDGVSYEPHPERRGLQRWRIKLVDAPVLETVRLSSEEAGQAIARLRLLHAAWCAGVAATAISEAVDYATQRHQFGRPIGTFQAIRHQLADAHVATTAARAYLAEAALGGLTDRAAVVASVLNRRALVRAGRVAQQVYGGFGYIAESAVHYPFIVGIEAVRTYGALRVDEALVGRDVTFQSADNRTNPASED